MIIKIESVKNGLIISTSYSDGTGDVEVFRTDNCSEDDVEERVAALWHLIDELGWYGSKHDEKRIRVIIETNGEEANGNT